jgi:hypothetical protein
MTCKACEVEAEIGTEEIPHPVDVRLHTCVTLDAHTRWQAARAALRLMHALLEDEGGQIAPPRPAAPQRTFPDGVAFDVQIEVQQTAQGTWAVAYGAQKCGDPMAVSGGLSGEHTTLGPTMKRALDDVGFQIQRAVRGGAPVTIYVNTEPKLTSLFALTYEDVCATVHLDPKTNPTVTWSRPGTNDDGILCRTSKPVPVSDGMRFNAIHTGNA